MIGCSDLLDLMAHRTTSPYSDIGSGAQPYYDLICTENVSRAVSVGSRNSGVFALELAIHNHTVAGSQDVLTGYKGASAPRSSRSEFKLLEMPERLSIHKNCLHSCSKEICNIVFKSTSKMLGLKTHLMPELFEYLLMLSLIHI